MPKGPDYESYGNIALGHCVSNLLEASKQAPLNPEQYEHLAEAFAVLAERVEHALEESGH